MAQFLYANNAATTIAGPIAATATTVNLAAGTGALFPQPGTGQQFALTFVSNGNPNVIEIVYCTGRSGDVCTILRGQEGTPATAFIAGDLASNDLTAGTCATFIQAAQLQQQATNYAVDTGPVNALQIALVPQPGSLALIAGAPIRILVGHTNTANTTLTIAGLPTTTVFAQNGATNSLAAGSIAVGQIYEFTYVPGVGFEVATAKVLLSTANTWAATQTIANGVYWAGNNTSGASQFLIGTDTSNNATLFAGPSGSQAWRVVNNNANATLMYLGALGILHVIGGIVADTGDVVSTNGGMSTALDIVAGRHLRAVSTVLGTSDANGATLLGDFSSGSNSTGWWTTFPSFGLTSSNVFMIQGGSINAPGNNSGAVYPLPRSFPNINVSVLISYGAAVPPTQGAIGAQPSGPANFLALNSSLAGGTNGCNYIAIGW